MTQLIGRTSEFDVIKSGTVVAFPGDRLEIIPFDDDTSYSIEIIVKITEEIAFGGTWQYDGTVNPLKLFITRPWNGGVKKLSTNIAIAQNSTHIFYADVIFEPIGTREHFNTVVTYSVRRKPK